MIGFDLKKILNGNSLHDDEAREMIIEIATYLSNENNGEIESVKIDWMTTEKGNKIPKSYSFCLSHKYNE